MDLLEVSNFSYKLNPLKSLKLKDKTKLDNDDRLSIHEALQLSFELNPMLENFCRQSNRIVNFAAMQIQAEGQTFEVKLSDGHRYYRSFNLEDKGILIGNLTFKRHHPFESFEISLLSQMVKLLQASLGNALHMRRLQQQVRSDYLTGIGNRAHFDEILSLSLDQQQRQPNQGLVLVLLDLNGFKQINDQHGHAIGDDVLIRFANILQTCIRGSDRCFRIGGDEFALLLSPANAESARNVERRLALALTQNDMLCNLQLSTSFGYSLWNSGDNAEALFNSADQNMYDHKRLSSKLGLSAD